MTERYLGSLITASPTEPSEGYADSTASGVWNVHDPLIFNRASDWPDPTEASPDKFIENLFSCFKYTGTGSARTITNGINLSGSGGLVWIKSRSATGDNSLFDTERMSDDGISKVINSDSTGVARNFDAEFPDVTSTGFGPISGVYNTSSTTYISWTFRKQPKFFDVVTYTGDGATDRDINHNLGSEPGMIIIKRTDSAESWIVYHRGLHQGGGGTAATTYWSKLELESTGTQYGATRLWGSGAGEDHTTTTFHVSSHASVNANTGTFVAYLFAHNDDDGGFGSTGDQDIIKCGSYTGNGSSSNAITLGFEPQWIMIKNATATADWILFDTIRGIVTGDNDKYVFPNATSAEGSFEGIEVTADGFRIASDNATTNNSSQTYVYMAIRRGPMKAPTAGTQVFFPDLITANQSDRSETGIGFSPDVIINLVRSRANHGQQISSRITGPTQQLFINYNSAESASNGTALKSFDMDGYTLGADTAGNGWNRYTGDTSVKHCFKRAPGFFDVITYTGTGSEQTLKHNLGAVPELIIRKRRDGIDSWEVASQITSTHYNLSYINTGDAGTSVALSTDGMVMGTPTSTQFNALAGAHNFLSFLFATVAGVSKVGSYSGTGNDINVDCGFTSGARFILIKRTDSSGDWYVWDSARGIVAGNDPYMLYGPGAAVEVTNTDYVDPLSSGFTVTSGAPSDLNTSGGTYLFLAIA